MSFAITNTIVTLILSLTLLGGVIFAFGALLRARYTTRPRCGPTGDEMFCACGCGGDDSRCDYWHGQYIRDEEVAADHTCCKVYPAK